MVYNNTNVIFQPYVKIHYEKVGRGILSDNFHHRVCTVCIGNTAIASIEETPLDQGRNPATN